ncbi:hypothetical protein [Pseudomonas fluorescens]|jgi:hypothetical protein|uniref:hypothetical protein n=1 Tax=Pseudomonas fluorescens TaxID=294 RepID=UPI0020C53410|nr:hypothetical protein [Pseudomonas fluorescens]UTL92464.1 hypothetical protein NLL86_06940 [Pseudomonas fluorescens]
MKLKTLRPLYLGGQTLVEGTPFETIEQHGRQLIQKGYAELDESERESVVTISQEDAAGAGVLTSASLSVMTQPLAASGAVSPLSLKQEGHGKWIIIGEEEKQVGDFVGNKAEAQKELDRLAAQVKPEQE